jgi:hypothetical protein
LFPAVGQAFEPLPGNLVGRERLRQVRRDLQFARCRVDGDLDVDLVAGGNRNCPPRLAIVER